MFCSLAVLAEERNPLECLDAFGATGRKFTVQKELKAHDDNKYHCSIFPLNDLIKMKGLLYIRICIHMNPFCRYHGFAVGKAPA